MPSSGAAGNVQIIARNSMWYGLEVLFEFLVAFATSIPMARTLGPKALGYFNLLFWLVNISGLLASMGAPATTRKYMAEFLAGGKPGMARDVFDYTLRWQIRAAFVSTLLGLCAATGLVEQGYRVIAVFLVLSVFPAMLRNIPAQANTAREDFRANVVGSVTSGGLNLIFVLVSLWMRWDLLGISIGIFVSRAVELVVRMVSTMKWIRELPKSPSGLPAETRGRIRSFSLQSLFVMLLNLIVWNRSDMLFLRWISGRNEELAFYGLAFNLTEKAMLAPRVFAAATGASLMAQLGRNSNWLGAMVVDAGRYLMLVGMPLLWGLAALSTALVPALYGRLYLPVVPILTMAAFAALPTVMIDPAQTYLQANEDQKYIIVWTCFAGLLDMGLDILLIPGMGAYGAAVANSVAQATASIGLWARVARHHKVKMPWMSLIRLLSCGLLMFVVTRLMAYSLPRWWALALAPAVGAVVYCSCLRIFTAMHSGDFQRLESLRGRFPAGLRGVYLFVLRWISGSRQPGLTAAG